MTDNIYLVGFMGSGKSTVGKILAKHLNRTFMEMDTELERQFGLSIPEVFEELGEKRFRDRESRLLKKLSKQERLVVATGGGVPERNENIAIMRSSGRIVHLNADLETCTDRLNPSARKSRPIWQDRQSLEDLFESRRSLYSRSDFDVPVAGHNPRHLAAIIANELYPQNPFDATLGNVNCPVIPTYDAPRALSEIISGARRTALLTDRKVARLHLDRFRKHVEPTVELIVQPGEKAKTLARAEKIYEALMENRFDRDDLLVALGGGVITDLGAFVASTYKRGMGLVLVSTTLLGCVDAAVGGKAAVNLGRAKNMIGCFSTPDAVILDIPALRTLDRKRISEGLVEAYKTGLVACSELAELVESESRALLGGDQPLLGEVVALSARTKAEVVSEDFREGGRRRILNFGHTFGHAVEGFHSFKVSHGQAVALGMAAAVQISQSRGLIERDTAERIQSTISKISPYRVAPPSATDAWEIMLQDKKIRRGRMVFVLLEGIGKPVCVEDVTQDELAASIRRIEEESNG
jgi:shikimate kinase / 3-dehydroquinate synthase